MKFNRTTRRRFLLAMFLGAPAAVVAHARWIEPSWLKVRRLRLCDGTPTHRFIQFTDLHHKGDRAYAESMVKTINAWSPDFVCFTGDLIEEKKFLPETLSILSGIKSPLYGVPGNHDYWSRAVFADIAAAFTAAGGGWLMDEQRVLAGGKIVLTGASCRSFRSEMPAPRLEGKNILLMHYPAWVKRLGSQRFDLILAGHSHGGQVRIPFHGPIFLPFFVDEFDLGMFETRWGRLYVNPGIGWYPVPYRFRCRPEITVVEI